MSAPGKRSDCTDKILAPYFTNCKSLIGDISSNPHPLFLMMGGGTGSGGPWSFLRWPFSETPYCPVGDSCLINRALLGPQSERSLQSPRHSDSQRRSLWAGWSVESCHHSRPLGTGTGGVCGRQQQWVRAQRSQLQAFQFGGVGGGVSVPRWRQKPFLLSLFIFIWSDQNSLYFFLFLVCSLPCVTHLLLKVIWCIFFSFPLPVSRQNMFSSAAFLEDIPRTCVIFMSVYSWDSWIMSLPLLWPVSRFLWECARLC